jgi:hypothetical protein
MARPLYAGAQFDQNGCQPFPIGGKRVAVDVNKIVFTLMSLLLAVAVICLTRNG